jgi:transposase
VRRGHLSSVTTNRDTTDTARAATTGEVQDLRREARALKKCVADLTLENRLLQKA